MPKLAETYIHLKIEPTDDFLDASKAYLYHQNLRIAKDIFHGEIELYVRVEEGSFKAWITVLGLIYIGIGQYGSFRGGIDHVVNDARWFSEYVITEFLNESQKKGGQISY